jgi:hypothetical protein
MTRADTRRSPEIRLAAAYAELDDALDACPHWDWESDGAGEAGCACCYRVEDATRAVRAASAACEAGRMVAI